MVHSKKYQNKVIYILKPQITSSADQEGNLVEGYDVRIFAVKILSGGPMS
jgi:hypothetical protein